MGHLAKIGLGAAALAAQALAAWPSPEPIRGTIPNNTAFPLTLDPTLVRRADGKLFLYTTGGDGGPGASYETYGMNGTVWTSEKSLYGPWTKSAIPAFAEPGSAPSIHRAGSDGQTYYMYMNSWMHEYRGVSNPASDEEYHDASVKVLTSRTLEPGSWTDQGRLDVSWHDEYNILDPSLLTFYDATHANGTSNTTANGGGLQHLLSFGSYQAGIFQIPLTDPPVALSPHANGAVVHLAHNSSSTPDGFADPIEGSYQYQHGGRYYLFFSSGRCAPEHGTPDTWLDAGDVYKVMVCRSETPAGPFADRDGNDCRTQNGGTEVLASHGDAWAPGGQGVMDDTDGEVGGPVLYYHYVPYNTSTNMPEKGWRFGWNKLDFDDGWPVIVEMDSNGGGGGGLLGR